jgi:hypothetical protein
MFGVYRYIRAAVGMAIVVGVLTCCAASRPPQANSAVVPQAIEVVEFRDGKLTIHAENVRLVDLLKLVAQKTGVTIYVPPGTGDERIVEIFGPGPVRDALTHLLWGSEFNFTIMYSPEHPDNLEQVVLSVEGPRQGGQSRAPEPTQSAASSVLWMPPVDTSVQVLPPQYDETLTAPKAALSPEALSELMRKKGQEVREKANQQYPPQ